MIIDRIKVHQYLTTELGLDKAIADGIVEAVSAAEDNVATSDDIGRLSGDIDRLSGEIERLRSDMNEKFRRLRKDFELLREDVDEREGRLRKDMDGMEERIVRKLVVHVYGAAAFIAALLAVFEFVV